ncbi:uncharacterized protein EKO05_0007097 [Ascochyta rabiei]|uniref:uncharacterized protein n=1 Tax=Didymella rabiei TaxID=5454 RepID=UPI001901A758|nr:uncharacterized protein EKO05_0007097 [Ascochyta rabiei]UPX16709.1 hypothetical protein EKO05_0007097 [Ascochyta rabiei]
MQDSFWKRTTRRTEECKTGAKSAATNHQQSAASAKWPVGAGGWASAEVRGAAGDWRLATGDWRLATGDWWAAAEWTGVGRVETPTSPHCATAAQNASRPLQARRRQ